MDGARSALILASDAYTDPGLRRLRAPASDARALAAVLRDPGIGGFQVRTLLNQPAHEVNLAVEEFFADRQPDDLLLLHVSCHGIKDEDGELYFATTNTRLRRLGATAVAAEFVNRRMNRSRSRRVVLLLDCCYAGAFERGMTARAGTQVGIETQFGGRGRAVITASSAMEYAFEGDELADTRELSPSVFTSALVEGLQTGEADRDQDGMVALDELYDYVYDKVRAATPNQTPGKWVFGVQGDLYIARRAHPVTTPASLPRELQEAIDSPFAAVRAGAVQELARLLQGRHAGLALAGRLTLQRLTNDDSRTVVAAATAALGAQMQPAPAEPVPPQPAPPKLVLSATVVDFGWLPLHGKAPERRVGLDNAGGGILNARAATQASWLKLRQVDDELVVGVDPTEVGEHEGVVTVDSDGGSGTIRVLARVEPAPLSRLEPAAATHPEGAPPAPERDRLAAQQDAALAGASPAPVGAAPPVAATAPTPMTPAGEAVTGPTIGPTPAPTGVDRRAASQARDDRLLLVAGGLAIAGAVLLVVGLFPTFVSTDQGTSSLVQAPNARWYALIAAALALGAGACMLIPGTRRFVGTGLLLGTVAASTWALVVLVNHALVESGFGGGLWIEIAACLILLLAACLAGVALARAGEVRLMRRPPQGALPWLVALLGAAGALALIFHDQNLWRAGMRLWVASSIYMTVMALVVPACAAVALPRRFGLSLLTGWSGGGVAVSVNYYLLLDMQRRGGGVDIDSNPIIAFAVTLLVLLIVAYLFALAAPTSQVGRPARG